MLQSYWSDCEIAHSISRVRFFRKKLDVDLPLDQKIVPTKFHRNRLYGVETYSEQTDRQTFFFIYIDRRQTDRHSSLYI